MNEFRPHYLHSYPTALELIAQRRLDHGSVVFDPELISFGSEAVLPKARSLIQAAFPKSLFTEEYGTTECVPLGYLCDAGKMHVNADYCIIEAVDVDDQPVPAGVFSNHVLITNLVNTCQPIIHYRLDDSVRFLPESCHCGRALPTIEVRGRADDAFLLHDDAGKMHEVSGLRLGISLHPIIGLAQFQATHAEQNVIRIRFTTRPGASVAEVQNQIRSAFFGALKGLGIQDSVSIHPEPVDAIERTGRGQKLRQFISHVAPVAFAEPQGQIPAFPEDG